MNAFNTSRVKSNFSKKLSVILLALVILLGVIPIYPSSLVHADAEDYVLSLNRPVYASSSVGGSTPDLVVDGKENTRWESVWKKDSQWIYIDLGKVASISRVVINWENAYSTAYQIQISNDEVNWTSVYSTTEGKGGINDIKFTEDARYVRLYSTKRSQEAYGISIWEISVYGKGGLNPAPHPDMPDLALNQHVVVSSQENEQSGRDDLEEKNYLAQNATDGNRNTRWSSKYSDNEWIYVDLGQSKQIGSVTLDWENAYGRAFDLQISDDANTWTTVYRQLSGSGGKQIIPLYAEGRYVRMYGIGRSSENGYSLFEFGVREYWEGDPKTTYVIPDIPVASSVNVGAGSYLINDITQLEPKKPEYKTADIQAPIPSNGWWQSLLISNLGDGNSLVTLPFKNKYSKQGLAILNPGGGYASADGGSMDADGEPDLYLMASSINPAGVMSKVSGYGDYSANVILSDDDTAKMSTTFIKGSPFIYNTFENPDSIIIQSAALTGLYDDKGNPLVLNDGEVIIADHIGLEITNQDKAPKPETFIRNYGVFAPPGTEFMKLGNTVKIKLGSGENYLSIATMPSAQDLNYFYRHAYAFVTDTVVDYNYDQSESMVNTSFTAVTNLKRPGFSSETLVTLLPHQWKVSPSELTGLSYPSIRGTLKLHEGNTFSTAERFYGIIPQFVEPDDSTYSRAQLIAYLDSLDADLANGYMIADPYWQGKKLHPLSLAVIISDQLGDITRRDSYVHTLKTILTDWYTYSPDEPLHSYYFHYSQEWGALNAYHSGFGLNTGLTDHHFTYGYYIFASAVLAQYDQEFVRDYGDMVEMLIRDYANPSRTDEQFPWFRNFDPYEGHSWAGGYADNRSGNNQEAAGESLFSWVGEYMWGMVTGNDTYRDAGIWGFTTEEKAIEQYWFNYDQDNWLPGYKHSIVGQVYGSAYLYGTFFSGDPQHIYGIHWLPPAEWMSYYGREPEKAAQLYEGMVRDNGGPENVWQHLIWPFESISNPESVLAKWDASNMQQNEVFNAYWFVHSMASLGNRTTDIWASDPGVTIYKKDNTYTAQIWNPSDSVKTYNFYNKGGQVGSATVYAHGLVKVDPTTQTTVKPKDENYGIRYLDSAKWKITAFNTAGGEPISNMTDGSFKTRWSSGIAQNYKQWIQIDLGAVEDFDTIFMNSGTSYGDYARGYEILVSEDGDTWSDPVTFGKGNSASIAVSMKPQTARYIKISLTEAYDSWWSIAELSIAKFVKSVEEPPVTTEPGNLEDRSRWTVTASTTNDNEIPANVLDGNQSTRWSTGHKQTSGQWLKVDLGSEHTFDTIVLDTGDFNDDYGRSYNIYASIDGLSWGTPVTSSKGITGEQTITFPAQTSRYLKIVQTGEASNWWSVSGLEVHHYGVGKPISLSRDGWSLTASTSSHDALINMLDGDVSTRWSTGMEQKNGQWIELDMGESRMIDQVILDSGNSKQDYIRGYELYLSADGQHWGNPVTSGVGKKATVKISFPEQAAKYIKIVSTDSDSHWWSIADLQVLGRDHSSVEPGADDQSPQVLDREGWKLISSASSDQDKPISMLDALLDL